MSGFVAAAVQLRSGRDVAQNIEAAAELIRAAARDGALYVQTPEMTNLLESNRASLFEKIVAEEEDPCLSAFRALARELGIFLHVGSLAIRTGETAAANRAFLISPDGAPIARYDKIHMFDVDLPDGRSWRESSTYERGAESVVAELPFARLGIAICYDIRFPAIYRAQARLGAQVLTAPAAFTRLTGEAHWHVLQRARAIENAAFVISAAQGGRHEDGRETFGHSLIVGPWGEIVAELANDEPGILLAEIDTAKVADARRRIPAIANEQAFELVTVGGNAEAAQ